mgnify:CR=1 FL=1
MLSLRTEQMKWDKGHGKGAERDGAWDEEKLGGQVSCRAKLIGKL